ncbi:low molecular weight protein-tyrosine-phosphatase [Ramlibacter sp. PS3R-8]|uniref:low molecular weight protein-tyrosine-phosphatase n=1 Tax=Ramlibacter sp. PS3R-8 TaxID=3133437 RepID=UPI0030B4A851
MKNILVLCEGNICRSPMAAALLAAAAPDLHVTSAGLGALVGHPADPLATRLMAERGVDIKSHRAVQVTRPLCVAADVILVMENAQRKRVEDLYPETRGRVFRLDENDVPDPYRKPEAAFRLALAGISTGVQSWTRKLKQI